MGILVSAHLNWGFSQRLLHSGSDSTLENKPSITLFYCSFLFTPPNKDIQGHREDLFCFFKDPAVYKLCSLLVASRQKIDFIHFWRGLKQLAWSSFLVTSSPSYPYLRKVSYSSCWPQTYYINEDDLKLRLKSIILPICMGCVCMCIYICEFWVHTCLRPFGFSKHQLVSFPVFHLYGR